MLITWERDEQRGFIMANMRKVVRWTNLSSIKYRDTQHWAETFVQKKLWLICGGDGQPIAKYIIGHHLPYFYLWVWRMNEQICPPWLDRLCTALKLNLDSDTCFVFFTWHSVLYLLHRPYYSGHSPCATFPFCLETVVHCLATALQIVTV